MNWKKTISVLMKLSAAMLSVSLVAKCAAGYIVRGWSKLCKKRDLSVDVIEPNYGPALVVSTEDFEDELGQILADGYHTQTLLRVTRLEILRKAAVCISLCGMVVTFILWLARPEENRE